jgi:hypothetical protein
MLSASMVQFDAPMIRPFAPAPALTPLITTAGTRVVVLNPPGVVPSMCTVSVMDGSGLSGVKVSTMPLMPASAKSPKMMLSGPGLLFAAVIVCRSEEDEDGGKCGQVDFRRYRPPPEESCSEMHFFAVRRFLSLAGPRAAAHGCLS